MNNLSNGLWIEWRKALRSRMPLYTTLGFLIAPLACAFLMFIYKDPDFARKAGIISAKANLMGGAADWPSYLNLLAQMMAGGGLLLFSLILSWLFGREYSDGTLKDLLAVPVPRSTILLAKFIVGALWAIFMAGVVYLVGMALGAVVGLPQGSSEVLWRGSLTLWVTAGLSVVAVTPFGLLANVGRGYLLPIGMTMLALLLANLLTLIGWGNLFPWSIAGLYAALAGKGQALEPVGYWIVLFTGLAGVAGTHLWWNHADQHR